MTIIRLSLIVIHSAICSVLEIIFALFDRSFFLYYIIVKYWSKGVLLLSGIKLNITGYENIDPKKAYVFVSNHSSLYDIPTLQATTPFRVRIVFKKELAKIPFFGWQLVLGPYIIIDRENREKAMKSIQNAKKAMLEKKESVLIFAEGTRSKTGEVQPFKRGAFYLAARVQHPIVPVSISGANKIMPKGKFKLTPGTISVHFDKPIEIQGDMNKKEEVALMNRVRDIIIENKKD